MYLMVHCVVEKLSVIAGGCYPIVTSNESQCSARFSCCILSMLKESSAGGLS